MRYVFAFLFWLVLAIHVFAQSQIGGRTSPDGTEEITIDLPASYHMKNVGGKDGAGLCVFTSGAMAGHWQGEPRMKALWDAMRKEPGGAWPEKLDRMIEKYCPGVNYVQHTKGHEAVLEEILRTGRIPCITYGYSPRYGGGVNHMVCLMHLSAKWGAVLDNNFPGVDQYEWMPRSELLNRWRMRSGGWCYALGNVPPPPIPTNASAVMVHLGEQPQFIQCDGPPSVPTVAGPAQIADNIATSSTDLPTGSVNEKIAEYGGDSINGIRLRGATLEDFLRVQSAIPSDRKRPYLTVIANKDEASGLIDTLRTMPQFKGMFDRYRVRGFKPDDPLIADVGFPCDKLPCIVVQDSERDDGKAVVKHRQTDWKGGPDAFLSAIRKSDPLYDASKDPDLRQAKEPPAPAPQQWYQNEFVWYVIVFAAGLIGGPTSSKLALMLQGLLSAKQPAPAPAPAPDNNLLNDLLNRLKDLPKSDKKE